MKVEFKDIWLKQYEVVLGVLTVRVGAKGAGAKVLRVLEVQG